MNFDFYR